MNEALAAEFGNRRLLIGAKEAGASSLLAKFVSVWNPKPGTLALVSSGAEDFKRLSIPAQTPDANFDQAKVIEIIRRTKPDAIVVGASVAPSIEYTLIDACRAANSNARVTSFVDHYWNLWQRFADEHTAEKWRYRPDHIFVPAGLCVAQLYELGATPGTVSAFTDPREPEAPLISKAEWRHRYEVPENLAALLFVSEWLRPQEELAKWQWEQPTDEDLEGLLRLVLDAAMKTSAMVLVKPHPSDTRSWDSVCSDYPADRYRMLPKKTDVGRMFLETDVAFGVNSELLIRAAQAGVPTFSRHPAAAGRDRWLSTLCPEIRELDGLHAAVAAIRARSAH